MKKLFLILLSVCIFCSSISISVMAVDSNIDVVIEEGISEELNSDVTVEDVMPNETLIEETIIEEVTLEETITEEAVGEDDSLENLPNEEEMESESITTNDEFTSSNLPRYAYTSEIRMFSLRRTNYTDEQKAAKLRDFLLERLNNIEAYQDELSFGEYLGSDTLYIDLSGLYDIELYYDTTTNKNATKEILRNAINDIQNKSPRTFWCKTSYTWSYNTDGKLTKLGFILNCVTDFKVIDGLQPVLDELNALTAEFDGYVQSIVDLIPDDHSDYEKILFVNDYLCTNYKYDTRYYTNPSSQSIIYNAYDFFKEGKGVCQAYTLAFMAIMDELGIKCDAVSSAEMKHIWNLVELNGKWYHIDVTWNDPCFQTLKNDTFGKARHKYFLLSSERIENIDTYPDNHYGFDVNNYGYEFGTEFDDIEVDLNKSLISSFIELNGTWYNTGYNDTKRTSGLYAFNSPDISSITNEDLKTPLYNIGLWRTTGNTYYPYAFSYLAKYNNTILFNTPTAICVFDGNNVAVLYVPEKANNEKIYGFTVKDNTIYIQLATDPNDGMKNTTVKTASLVDIVYMDYDGTILAKGFAVEGAEVPDLFIPDAPVRESTGYYEYTFDKWVTDDGVTFVAEYTKSLKEGVVLPNQEGITISSIPNNLTYGDDGFKINVSTTEKTPDLGSFEYSIVDENGNPAENSKVATVDEEGNVTINAAGTTYIKVSRAGDEDYADFEQIETLIVAPKEILITPTSDLSKYEGQKDVELTYTLDNAEIINPEKDIISGALSRTAGEMPGVYNITLGTLKINDNYKLILPETAVTFEIEAKLNQDVTVSEIDNANLYYGDTLKVNVTLTTPDLTNAFAFVSNNEEIATIDEEGKITFVGAGTVKITVSNAGNHKYNNYEKVLTFNVSKREIELSAIDFIEKKATFTNNLDADTTLNLDFNKAIVEVKGICEEDNTKSNVNITNLILFGDRAEFYTLSTEHFDCTIANTNIVDVNPKADNGNISGVGKYLANVEITLTATANSNYKFDGWFKNGTLISTTVTYTFNTSELEGVEARFSYINDNETNDGFSGGGAGSSSSGGGGGSSSGGSGGGGGGSSEAVTKPSTNTDKTEDSDKTANNKEEEKGSSEEIVPAVWNNPFVDVNENAWYYIDVKNIIEKKLMTGTADDTFSPDAATTRGMLVTILYRLEGEPSVVVNNIFNDVNSSDYYCNAIEWAVANGIVNGVGDSMFAPNEEITREQFAAILYRYASYKNLNTTSTAKLDNFSDNNEISTWATEAIAWANINSIITGTSPTTISPKNGAIRVQAAAMLNRFINLNNK